MDISLSKRKYSKCRRKQGKNTLSEGEENGKNITGFCKNI